MFPYILELTIHEGILFAAILGFIWFKYLFQEYLQYRERRVYYKNVEPPKELEGIMDETTYKKSRLYGLDKMKFALANNMFDQFLITGILICGVIPLIWKMSGVILGKYKYKVYFTRFEDIFPEILQTLVYKLIWGPIMVIPSCIWAAYFTFKVEQKHGFNKQTTRSFMKERLGIFLMSEVLDAVGVAGLIFGIKRWGDVYFFCLIVWFIFTIPIAMVVMQNCLPIFMKFKSLPEGDLKIQIEEISQEMKFPLKNTYIVEDSKRSAHSGAYFYGFCNKKRIALLDTLVEDYTNLGDGKNQKEHVDNTKGIGNGEGTEKNDVEMLIKKRKRGCTSDEILAVLCHEFGHWKLNHILKNIIITEIYLISQFMIFWCLHNYSPLYSAFGFPTTQPIFIGYILITTLVVSPFDTIFVFFVNTFSRYTEFQADEFACKLGRGEALKEALIKIDGDNLSFPLFDPLYSIWNYSLPSLLERIRAINKLQKDCAIQV